MVAFQITTTKAATGAETVALHPAPRDSTDAAIIASNTARDRPKRCASSLPVTEIATPARPASVNRDVGPGSQAGAPCRAIVQARNVTPQARSAASSQVCTV